MNSRNVNSKNVIGLALIVLATSLACVLVSSAGESAVRLVGKAAWYLPYVALVGAVRCLVRA